MQALPPNTMLEKYRIERVLGHGAFGITYLAVHITFDKRKYFAIKEYMPAQWAYRDSNNNVLPKTVADVEDFNWGLNEFEAEAIRISSYENQNIISISDFIKAKNNTSYFVMNYAPNGNLYHHIRTHGTLSEKEVKQILSSLISGLIDVHRDGELHRDLKPQNIVLDKNQMPIIIDFGSARNAMNTKASDHTQMYTEGYAPYEQQTLIGHLGPWTDIYSLAAIAYYCITGDRPPSAKQRKIQDNIKILGKGKHASAFLQSIDQALSIEYSQRPSSLNQWQAKWHNDGDNVTRDSHSTEDNTRVERPRHQEPKINSSSSTKAGYEMNNDAPNQYYQGQLITHETPSSSKKIVFGGVLTLVMLSTIVLFSTDPTTPDDGENPKNILIGQDDNKNEGTNTFNISSRDLVKHEEPRETIKETPSTATLGSRTTSKKDDLTLSNSSTLSHEQQIAQVTVSTSKISNKLIVRGQTNQQTNSQPTVQQKQKSKVLVRKTLTSSSTKPKKITNELTIKINSIALYKASDNHRETSLLSPKYENRELTRLIKQVEQSEMTENQLYDFSNNLTDVLIHQQDHLFASIYIPVQDLTSGAIKMSVVTGKITTITMNNINYQQSKIISDYFKSIQGRVLKKSTFIHTIETIEQRINNRLEIGLESGEKIGETMLTLSIANNNEPLEEKLSYFEIDSVKLPDNHPIMTQQSIIY